MNSVQRETALNQSGAIRAPRRDAAPFVRRAFEIRARRRRDSVAGRLESAPPLRQSHRQSGGALFSDADERSEWKLARRAARLPHRTSERERPGIVPAAPQRTAVRDDAD